MNAAGRAVGVATSLALLFLAACARQGGEGPVEVKFDRDACHGCSMIISERKFVAEVRTPTGETLEFDDVGCAMKWLDAQPFAQDPAVQVWVAKLGDGAWLDARTATYLEGKTSPMGYGFGAVAAEPRSATTGADPGSGPQVRRLTFESMRQQARAIAQRRH